MPRALAARASALPPAPAAAVTKRMRGKSNASQRMPEIITSADVEFHGLTLSFPRDDLHPMASRSETPAGLVRPARRESLPVDDPGRLRDGRIDLGIERESLRGAVVAGLEEEDLVVSRISNDELAGNGARLGTIR